MKQISQDKTKIKENVKNRFKPKQKQ